MNLSAEWNSRAVRFWKDVSRYGRYIFNSGTIGSFFLIFIMLSYYYGRFIQAVPVGYPTAWIALLIITPAVAYSPIRTFLKPADILFLLRMESTFRPYWMRAWIFSFVLQAVLLLFVWIVFSPLYQRSMGDGAEPFWLMYGVLLAFKAGSLYGSWQEKQMINRSAEYFYKLLRWLAAGLSIWIWFTYDSGLIIIFILLLYLTYAISMKIPSRHYINWERLIEQEGAARYQYYVFISWFVDVDGLDTRIHRRRFLSQIFESSAFSSANAYYYLYGKTMLRTDLLGIVVRLGLLGAVLIVFIPDLWAKGGVYLLFMYMIGLQLSTLLRHHKYSLWNVIYPVPIKAKVASVAHLVFRIQVIIAIAMHMSLWWRIEKLWTLPLWLGAALLMSFWMSYYRLPRKWKAEQEL